MSGKGIPPVSCEDKQINDTWNNVNIEESTKKLPKAEHLCRRGS